MNDHGFYQDILSHHLGALEIKGVQSVAGGCINATSKAETSRGRFFIKVNDASLSDLFEKEERGLSILSEHSPVSVPGTIGSGLYDQKAYLILEWLEPGHRNTGFWSDFGQKLASQHKKTADFFGLDHDNHIGMLHQSNKKHDSWHPFFIEERLVPQIALAEQKGLMETKMRSQFETLFKKLKQLIPETPPSLLHGDLWSGNFLCGPGSCPYIFDPAVYYGHPETELAFTRLFGGFDPEFYQAYSRKNQLEPYFEERIDLHNLYPLLVHVNLFGASYLSGIRSTLNRFC